MKITIILLAITVSWTVAFPSGLGGILGGLPILGDILGGGGGDCKNHGNSCNHGKGAHDKHNSLVCLNSSFYYIYK